MRFAIFFLILSEPIVAIELRGIAPRWTGHVGDVADLFFGVPDPAQVSVVSSVPRAIGVNGLLQAVLVGDHWAPVNLTVVTPSGTYTLTTEPHVSPLVDGDLDAGPRDGIVVRPISFQDTFELPVFVRAVSAPLRAYTLEARFPGVLSPRGCTPGDIQGGVCGVLSPRGCTPGDIQGLDDGMRFWRAAGSLASSSVQGERVLVGTFRFAASGDNVLPTVSLVLLDAAIGSAVVRGSERNVTILVGAGGPFANPAAPALQAVRAPTWGDTEGTGVFSSLSVLFLEMYVQVWPSRQPLCLSRCQWSDELSPWQLQMANPLRIAGPPSLEAKSFLLCVLVGQCRFLASWNATGRPGGFDFSALLLDWSGNPAPPSDMAWIQVGTGIPLATGGFPAPLVQGRRIVYLARGEGGVWNGSVDASGSIELAPVSLVSSVSYLGDARASYLYYTFFSQGRPLDRINVTAPLTPSANPIVLALSTCCNATISYPGSSASAFFPSQVTLASCTGILGNGTALAIPWEALEASYDADLVVRTGMRSWAARDGTNTANTTILLSYMGLTSNTTLLLVGQASLGVNVTLGVSHRVHCMDWFEPVPWVAWAEVQGVPRRFDVTQDTNATSSPPGMLLFAPGTITPAAPGLATASFSWRGSPPITKAIAVYNDTTPLSALECPGAYEFYGQRGESVQLGAMGVLPGGRRIPVPPGLLVVGIPPAVKFTPPSLASSLNSAANDTVAMGLPQCQGVTLSCSSPLLVNLAPAPLDVDIGETSGLALQGTAWPIRLNQGTGVEAYMIQVFLGDGLGYSGCESWGGRCGYDEGAAVFAGVSPLQTGILPVGILFVAGVPGSISVRVETVGTRGRVVIDSQQYGSLATPPPPPAPLLDIVTALRKGPGNCTDELLVLTGHRRVLTPMVFSSDLEITLMVRLQRRSGRPSQDSVWLLVRPWKGYMAEAWEGARDTGMGLLVPGRHTVDGWHGVQFRGGVDNASISVSLAIDTGTGPEGLVALGDQVVGIPPSGPGFQLVSGTPYPECPWDTPWPAAVQVEVRIKTFPQEANRGVLACALGVAPRRVTTHSTEEGVRVVAGVESFLRQRDVLLRATSVDTVQPAFKGVVTSVQRGEQGYTWDPPGDEACPQGSYWWGQGMFAPLKIHARVGPRCYGFTCDPGFEKQGEYCAPAKVGDDLYWAVVGSVIGVVASFMLAAIVVRGIIARRALDQPPPPPEPKEAKEEEDNTLPVSVSATGELVFISETVEEESTGSESSGEWESEGESTEAGDAP